jgi:two-component system, cell cycle response regulator
MNNNNHNNEIDLEPVIQIIDDMQLNLDFLSNSLKREGYKILSSNNGSQGIISTKTKNPDLILLDSNMPEMNGFSVCRELAGNDKTKHIPIIFLITKYDQREINKCYFAGGSDYVCKPVNMTELIKKIGIHLELKKYRELINPTPKRKKLKPLSEMMIA